MRRVWVPDAPETEVKLTILLEDANQLTKEQAEQLVGRLRWMADEISSFDTPLDVEPRYEFTFIFYNGHYEDLEE